MKPVKKTTPQVTRYGEIVSVIAEGVHEKLINLDPKEYAGKNIAPIESSILVKVGAKFAELKLTLTLK